MGRRPLKLRKPGTRNYYYPNCSRCGKKKGQSYSQFCLSCAHYKPKKGLIKLSCPHCGQLLSRDEIVIMLYWAGTGSDTLGKVFGVTKQRILQITRKSRDENHHSSQTGRQNNSDVGVDEKRT